MTTSTPPIAAVPAQPDALSHEQVCDILETGNPTDEECRLIRLGYGAAQVAALTAAQPQAQVGIQWQCGPKAIAFGGCPECGKRDCVARSCTRGAPAAQGAAERAMPADAVAKRRASYLRQDTDAGRAYVAQFFKASGCNVFDDYIHQQLAGDFACELAAMLSAAPAHVQTPAQTEHVVADVSQNGLGLNTAGAALLHDLEVIANTTLHATIEGSRKSYERDVVRKAIEVIRASHAQAPAGAALGLPTVQEPKYTVTGTHIVNRATGEAIPHDEPVFVFRARDALGVRALQAYLALIGEREPSSEHADAVRGRIADFQRFAAVHPDRMKWPDTKAQAAQAAPAAGAVAGPSVTVRVGTQEFDLANFGEHFTSADMHTASVQAFREGQAAAAPTPTAQADSGATPSQASIAWNALRDATDPLGEAGTRIMEHVRVFAQRQYEAGLAESRADSGVQEDAALTDEQIDAVTLAQWGEMRGHPLAAHRAYARAILAARATGAKP